LEGLGFVGETRQFEPSPQVNEVALGDVELEGTRSALGHGRAHVIVMAGRQGMLFRSGIKGTASPGPGAPPQGLLAFYWHFVKQTKGWFATMFALSLVVALLDTVMPLFIGRLVSLMEATDRHAALAQQWPLLAGMVLLVLFVRPAVLALDMAIRHNAIMPGAVSLV